MAAFATVDDYQEWLSGREGTIPLAEFDFWAKRATEEINAVTFGHAGELEEPTEAVISATCEYAEFLLATHGRENIASISVTGHSISFDRQSKDGVNMLRRLLANTGLLYKGACD